MNSEIGIIFINGAGLNSSIWNDLKSKFQISNLTIDLTNKTKLTFDDYVNKFATEISNWKMENFIIVAHSIGALIGLKVAEQFKKELKGFVAIGSVIPKSGQSFTSTMPFPQKILLPILLSLFGTKPPKKSIETELCNDLSPDIALKIANEFTPEAKALYTTKNTYELPNTKRLYIKLTNDKSLHRNLQDKMAKNLNATKIESINSGHLPMLSKPDELANILEDFINKLKHY